MFNEKIILERIKRLIQRTGQEIYLKGEKATCEYSYDPQPIPYEKVSELEYRPIQVGEIWGQAWGSAWFKISGKLSAVPVGKQAGLWLDFDGEACVWKDGSPWQGLTNKVDWYHNASKFFVPLSEKEGESFELLVEVAANGLFGSGKEDYRLCEACICFFDTELFGTFLELELLFNLAESLDKGSTRYKRLVHGLNEVCNLWNTDREGVAAILKELSSHKANSSALTAYSVGHAHLDLAWLWPLRESIRKGGRTFSNALRYLEKYPDYVFGASQAQLYQWIKVHYPALYSEVKAAIKTGKWEVQGASWVEFDTNMPSGESLVRQFMYGKRYFRDEFGIEPDTLWLPDCFGFNANLPQIMQGCEVKHFMTQKLSWNETNTFPHHLFIWEGIDGSRIRSHQLPTNDYNFSNNPSSMLETEKRFAQGDIADSFLNLYGIGDGGGGPTAHHVEYGLLMQDIEGLPKFRFAPSTAFFDHISSIPEHQLPVMYGELYLEFHRGTYTTQALMKKNNRANERLLAFAELTAVLSGAEYPASLRGTWEKLLLLQFHDILPGSSIKPVYEDAARISNEIAEDCLHTIHSLLSPNAKPGTRADDKRWYMVLSRSNRETKQWVELPLADGYLTPCDAQGNVLPHYHRDKLMVWMKLPPLSMSSLYLMKGMSLAPERQDTNLSLENAHIRVLFSERGSILSIWDKETNREVLKGESNLLKLWEDEPNNWGAWDINHYYRETTPSLPKSVRLCPEECIATEKLKRLVFAITIGESQIKQTVELWDDKLIRIKHSVDWKEHHKMLRVHFLPDIYANEATYEIQFGVIKRTTKPRNQWELAQFEVPAHRFADLSEAGYGTALINDSKYGYRIRDNEMELSLLRSPADVDPDADIHHHEYSYAFYPHVGCYEDSDVLHVAHEFNDKAEIIAIPEMPLIPAIAIPFIPCSHIKLDTIKPAEDGKGIIYRLYEFCGKSGMLELELPFGYTKASLCNMVEHGKEDLEVQASKLTLHFRPFEIVTVRIEL